MSASSGPKTEAETKACHAIRDVAAAHIIDDWGEPLKDVEVDDEITGKRLQELARFVSQEISKLPIGPAVATSDPALIMGAEQVGVPGTPGYERVPVPVICTLCNTEGGAGTVLLFDPALVRDSNGFVNFGICRACTVRAVKVWAETPEGFSAVLAPKGTP